MLFEFNFSDLKYTHSVSRSPVEADREKLSLMKIIWLAGGDGCIVSPGQQTVCSQGDLILLDKGQGFTLKPRSDTSVDYYLMYFTEFLIPSDLTTVVRYAEGIYHVADSPIPALFSRFDWHLSNVGSGDAGQVKMLFRCVLTEILVYFSRIAGREAAIPGMLNVNIEPVLNFISRNLDRPLQIQDICAQFHYSRSHLCKIFTQVTGVPLMHYIRTARADYAQKLLRSGLPAMEVARQLGYSDYSSFYRMYRKYLGCSPSDTQEPKDDKK